MDQPSREARAAALAARLQHLPPEEVTRMGLVLLVRTAVSLVLQLLLLGIAARTTQDLYRNRHLGRQQLRQLLTNKPLVSVAILSIVHSITTAAWLMRWVHRANTATPD